MFYRGHYRLILTVAHQRLGTAASAEDVTAEVFRIAWAKAQEGETLTLPWIYTTLRNVIGNEYRRQSRLSAFIENAGPILTGDDEFRESVERRVEVYQALLKLPEADRELLIMEFWEDLDRSEIKEILGISAVALRLRMMRARDQLRKLLDKQGETSSEEAVLNGRA